MDLPLNKDEIRKQILSLIVDPDINFSLLSNDFNQIIPKIKVLLTKYTSGEFHIMEEELERGDLFVIFSNHAYHFKPSDEDLNIFLMHQNQFQQNKALFELFAIYAFHSWIFLDDFLANNEGSFLSSLLSILNSIINISYFKIEKKQFYRISLSCFIDIIIEIVNTPTVTFDQTFLSKEIQDFFFQDIDFSKYANQLLLSVSEKLLDAVNPLNGESYSWINGLINIIKAERVVISNIVIRQINDFIINHTVQLDQLCIKFFLAAIPYLPQKTVFKIIRLTLEQTVAKASLTSDTNPSTISEVDSQNYQVFTHSNKMVSDSFLPPQDLYQLNSIEDSIQKIPIDSKLPDFIEKGLYQGIKAYEAVITSSKENAAFFIKQAIEVLKFIDSTQELAKKESDLKQHNSINSFDFYRQYAIIINLIFYTNKKFPTSFSFTYNEFLLFNPEDTIFHPNADFSIINFLRNRIFQIFVFSSPSSLKEILFKLSIYPELYFESVCRLLSLFYNPDNEFEKALNSNDLLELGYDHRNFSDASTSSTMTGFEKSDLLNAQFCSFADALMVPVVQYRIMKDDNFDENERLTLLSTRKTILFFFNSFLSDNNNFTTMLSSSDFAQSFFILLYEPPIRLQFMGILRQYLFSIQPTKENEIIFKNLNANILLLFNTSTDDYPKDQTISLFSEFLNSINEAIIFNNSLAFVFEPLATDFCNNILKVCTDDSDSFEDLLLSLISFLAATSHDQINRDKELSLIEKRILHITKARSNKIMEKLVQIIAGKPLSVFLPTFEIVQSKVLCTFIRIFNETNYIYKAICFISKLCSFSLANCLKCHEGELDLLLIDMIDKWRRTATKIIPLNNSEGHDSNPRNIIDGGIDQFDEDETVSTISGTEIPEKKVDMFLYLLTQIASVVSSVSVVQRFISMLCPIDGKYLSLIHKNILNALNRILNQSRHFPEAALPMLPASSLKITNVPATAFENGISFLFWISMPSYRKDFHQYVLMIDDDKKHIFSISLNENAIRVQIQSGIDFYHGDFEVNLPFKTWAMITVTLSQSPQKTESCVTVYLNRDVKKTIAKFAPFQPKSSTVSCTINMFKPVNKVLTAVSPLIEKDPPMLGLFMLSKQLTAEEISALYDEGPRPSLSSRYNITFAYTPFESQQRITFKALKKIPDIKGTHFRIAYHSKTLSFYDLLLNYCKVSLILPIFGQLDIQLKDGKPFPYLANLAVEILANLFYLGNQPQISFFEANGFFVISHLLQNSDDVNITFNLYTRYFNLLGLISYPNLQLQLIDAILLKIDLWQKGDIKNQARILKHWSRNLYETAGSLIQKVRSVTWFIYALHYFYYSQYQSDAVDPSVIECRKYLFEIISSYFNTIQESYEYLTIIMGFIYLGNDFLSNTIEETMKTDVPEETEKTMKAEKAKKMEKKENTEKPEEPKETEETKTTQKPDKTPKTEKTEEEKKPELTKEINSKDIFVLNLNEKKDFISFLTTFIQKNDTIENGQIDSPKLLHFLIHCFDFKNIDHQFIVQCIELIIAIYRNYTIIEPLSTVVEFIIKKLIKQNIYYFDEASFTHLCQIMQTKLVPELLPIICINILHFNEHYYELFCNTLNLDINYYINEYSLLYPTLLLFKFVNSDIYEPLVRTTLNMFKGHWDQLINAINAVGYYSFDVHDVEIIKHDIFLEMTKTDSLDQQTANQVIRLIRDFLYFREINSEYLIFNLYAKEFREAFPQEDEESLASSCNFSDGDSSINKSEINDQLQLNRNEGDSQSLLTCSMDEVSFSTDEPSAIENNSFIGSPLVPSPLQSPSGIKNTNLTIRTIPSSFNAQSKLYAIHLSPAKSGPIEAFVNDDVLKKRNQSVFNRLFRKKSAHNPFRIPSIIAFIIEHMVTETQPISFHIKNAFHYTFGLRIDNSTGKWLDCDLAHACLQLYIQYQLLEKSPDMIILSHFLKQNDSFNPFVQEALSIAKEATKSEFVGDAFNGEVADFEKIQSVLTYHDEMFGLDLFGNALDYQMRSIEYSKSIWVSDTDIKSMAKTTNDEYHQFIHKLETEIQISKKIWYHLWRSLTIPRAPWRESVVKDHNKGYKRDNSYCYAFCPSKVREITNIDKHAKAAMIHDTGDTKLTEQRLRDMVAEPPKSLLFCSIPKDKAVAKEVKVIIDDNDHKNTNDDHFVRIDQNAFLPCEMVTIKGTRPALFNLGHNTIIIITDYNKRVIPSDNIFSVLYRTRNHRFAGLEIFTRTKESFLLLFEGSRFRVLIPRIRLMPSIEQSRIQTRDFEVFFNSLPITQNWIDGKISNFEYLMLLNMYSGRSFNDATKYPVFPWILSNYDAPTIKFDDPKTYRELWKPVGALDDARLQELLEKREEMAYFGEKPYLYSSGYSSPLTVYLWLIRLEPFTTQHIDIQEGKFDTAARIFKSISNSHLNATTMPNDYRELVPEFFFLPEFLKNMSGFDLGKTSEGAKQVRVNDVVLPPWANGSPMQFIYLHRKALESQYVSETLNHWIDLIWGYQQRGPEAEKANNIFPEQMYPDIWNKLEVELQQKQKVFLDIKTANFSKKNCRQRYSAAISSKIEEIESFLMNVGQVPEQLFTTPHPKKKVRAFVSSIKFFSDADYSTNQDETENDTIMSQSSFSTIPSIHEPAISTFTLDTEKVNDTQNSVNTFVKYSIINFQEVDSIATAHVFLSQPNKLKFYILDNYGKVSNFLVDFSSFKYLSISSKPKDSFHIFSGGYDYVKSVNTALFSPSKESSPTNASGKQSRSRRIISPMFIGDDRLCFIDQDRSSVKIINLATSFVDSIKFDLDIVSIQTDAAGWLAIAAKDAAVTLYNVNHLPQPEISASALLAGVNLNSSFNTNFNFVSTPITRNQSTNNMPIGRDSSRFSSRVNNNPKGSTMPDKATISSFRESIKCISINTNFDALICGTRDNWLLFCRLNIRKMAVNRMIETKGRPQKIIVTDSFGFVVAFLTKIEEGKLIEKIALYDINGEEIRTKELNPERHIVAMSKALSIPEAFDFLIVADDLNQIFVFEAFYLEFGQPIFQTQSRILKLVYYQEECLIIAFCADGTAAVIYYPIDLWASKDLTEIQGEAMNEKEVDSRNQES